MSVLYKRKLASGGALRLTIACVFLLCASLSALSHADTRSVEGFDVDTVVLRSSDELRITQGDANRLLVKGSSRYLDLQPFYVRGKTLTLGLSKDGKRSRGLQFLLEISSLRSVTLQGSGDIWIDPLTVDDLEANVAGSGTIHLYEINAKDLYLQVGGSGGIQLAGASVEELDVEVAGSGGIDLGKLTVTRMAVGLAGSGEVKAARESSAGMVESLDLSIAGSGEVNLSELPVRTAEVAIVGSGDAYLNVEEKLDVSVMGSGDVKYWGDPVVDEQSIGSGGVRRQD